MASESHRASEPSAGRYVVGIVALLGVAGIIAYAVMQDRGRTEATQTAEERVVPAAKPVPVGEITARVRAARQAFDVEELARLEPALEEAIARSTVPATALDAKLELADLHATRALEAAVRGGMLPTHRTQASKEIKHAIEEASPILAALESGKADQGRVRAATARLALAEGAPLVEEHPIVLMPTYRDTELRLVALSEPLWRGAGGDASLGTTALEELITELRRESHRTGLQNVLLAAALRALEREDEALMVLDEVLAEVPTQPTALGLRRQWTGAPAVVAAAPRGDGGADDLRGVGDGSITADDDNGEDAGIAIDGGADAADDGSARPEPTPPTDPRPAAVPSDPPSPPPADPPADPPPADPAPTPADPTPPPADPEPASDDGGLVPSPPEPAPADPPPAPAVDPPPDPVPDPAPKPTPKKPNKPKPPKKKKQGFDELLAEGCKLAKGGDANKGLKLLQKAHDIQPGGTKVTLCMAQAHKKLGRTPSARALTERILRKSPGNKQANLLMASIEAGAGNKAAAVRHYKKVLEKDPEHAKAKAYVEANG